MPSSGPISDLRLEDQRPLRVRCDALGREPASLDRAQQATLQASLFRWRQAWILPSNSEAMRVFEAGGGQGEPVSDAVRTLVLTMPQLLPPNETCEALRLARGRKSRRHEKNSLHLASIAPQYFGLRVTSPSHDDCYMVPDLGRPPRCSAPCSYRVPAPQ